VFVLNVELIFKIAAIGIIVAVLNQLLIKSDRNEQAMMVTIAGLIVVLVVIVREIANLFDVIQQLFGF
jgi:stage III sporulation protein AC